MSTKFSPEKPKGAKPTELRDRSQSSFRLLSNNDEMSEETAMEPVWDVQTISNRELKTAFDFLDVDNNGAISLQTLKKRLVAIYGGPEHIPLSELKFLMGNKKALTLKDFRKLIDETTETLKTTTCNPIQQAFNVFDPSKTGYINPSALGAMMERLGYPALSEEDLKILIETLDHDNDGSVGIEDFQMLLKPEQPTNKRTSHRSQEIGSPVANEAP